MLSSISDVCFDFSLNSHHTGRQHTVASRALHAAFLPFVLEKRPQIQSPSYPECESEIWFYLCLPCSSWKAGRIIGVIQNSGVLEQQAGALLSSVPPKIITSTSPNHLPHYTHTHTHIHAHTFSTSVRSFFVWFLATLVACRVLVPQPGIEPGPPAVEAQSLNPWTTREVPGKVFPMNLRSPP